MPEMTINESVGLILKNDLKHTTLFNNFLQKKYTLSWQKVPKNRAFKKRKLTGASSQPISEKNHYQLLNFGNKEVTSQPRKKSVKPPPMLVQSRKLPRYEAVD